MESLQDHSLFPTLDYLYKCSFPSLYNFVLVYQAFLLVAGDFELKEHGLCCREAVKELLHELNSKEGTSKLLVLYLEY